MSGGNRAVLGCFDREFPKYFETIFFLELGKTLFLPNPYPPIILPVDALSSHNWERRTYHMTSSILVAVLHEFPHSFQVIPGIVSDHGHFLTIPLQISTDTTGSSSGKEFILTWIPAVAITQLTL